MTATAGNRMVNGFLHRQRSEDALFDLSTEQRLEPLRIQKIRVCRTCNDHNVSEPGLHMGRIATLQLARRKNSSHCCSRRNDPLVIDFTQNPFKPRSDCTGVRIFSRVQNFSCGCRVVINLNPFLELSLIHIYFTTLPWDTKLAIRCRIDSVMT